MKKLILLFLISAIIISGCLTAPEDNSYYPDALTETAYVLPVALEILNTPRLSTIFYFKEGDILSTQSLVYRINDLNANQVCLSLGRNIFSENKQNENFEFLEFEGSNVQRIIYNEKETVMARSLLICSSDKTELIKTFYEFELDDQLDMQHCDICPDNETCCAVIVYTDYQ